MGSGENIGLWVNASVGKTGFFTWEFRLDEAAHGFRNSSVSVEIKTCCEFCYELNM